MINTCSFEPLISPCLIMSANFVSFILSDSEKLKQGVRKAKIVCALELDA